MALRLDYTAKYLEDIVEIFKNNKDKYAELLNVIIYYCVPFKEAVSAGSSDIEFFNSGKIFKEVSLAYPFIKALLIAGFNDPASSNFNGTSFDKSKNSNHEDKDFFHGKKFPQIINASRSNSIDNKEFINFIINKSVSSGLSVIFSDKEVSDFIRFAVSSPEGLANTLELHKSHKAATGTASAPIFPTLSYTTTEDYNNLINVSWPYFAKIVTSPKTVETFDIQGLVVKVPQFLTLENAIYRIKTALNILEDGKKEVKGVDFKTLFTKAYSNMKNSSGNGDASHAIANSISNIYNTYIKNKDDKIRANIEQKLEIIDNDIGMLRPILEKIENKKELIKNLYFSKLIDEQLKLSEENRNVFSAEYEDIKLIFYFKNFKCLNDLSEKIIIKCLNIMHKDSSGTFVQFTEMRSTVGRDLKYDLDVIKNEFKNNTDIDITVDRYRTDTGDSITTLKLVNYGFNKFTPILVTQNVTGEKLGLANSYISLLKIVDSNKKLITDINQQQAQIKTFILNDKPFYDSSNIYLEQMRKLKNVLCESKKSFNQLFNEIVSFK